MIVMLAACCFAGLRALAAEQVTLSNGKAEFGNRGLVSVADTGLGISYRFQRDEFAAVIDGQTYESGPCVVWSRLSRERKRQECSHSQV